MKNEESESKPKVHMRGDEPWQLHENPDGTHTGINLAILSKYQTLTKAQEEAIEEAKTAGATSNVEPVEPVEPDKGCLGCLPIIGLLAKF